jgi:hypothetical protein
MRYRNGDEYFGGIWRDGIIDYTDEWHKYTDLTKIPAGEIFHVKDGDWYGVAAEKDGVKGIHVLTNDEEFTKVFHPIEEPGTCYYSVCWQPTKDHHVSFGYYLAQENAVRYGLYDFD